MLCWALDGGYASARSIIYLRIAIAAAVFALHELNALIYINSHYTGQAGTWLAHLVAQASFEIPVYDLTTAEVALNCSYIALNDQGYALAQLMAFPQLSLRHFVVHGVPLHVAGQRSIRRAAFSRMSATNCRRNRQAITA